MAEVKEYVSVNEKEFWKNKTLELTINGRILDSNLQKIVQWKIDALNLKIDWKYDAGITDFSWENISTEEKIKLIADLHTIIKWFNEIIANMTDQYIWETQEKETDIQAEISAYFSDKSLFVNQWRWLVSALRGYAGMTASEAAPIKAKILPLN